MIKQYASSEEMAIKNIQALHPLNYVHSFGGNIESIDICVYHDEYDFERDSDEGGNDRIMQRYMVNCSNA